MAARLITIVYDPDENLGDDDEPLDLFGYLINEFEDKGFATRIQEADTVNGLIAAAENMGVAVLATQPIAEIAEANEVDEDTVRGRLPAIRAAISNSSAPESFAEVCFQVLKPENDETFRP